MNGPSWSYTGTHDPFCSGHTVAADGSVLVVGGLNYVEKCFSTEECITENSSVPDTNLPVGHKRIYKLDTSMLVPQWQTEGDWPAVMGREHWYPTAITMNDGSLFIAGHFGAPSPSCPVPNWEYGTTQSIDRVYESFDVGTATSAVNLNARVEPGCSTGQPPFSVGHYPRLYLLGRGAVLHTNALDTFQPPQPESPVSRWMRIVDKPCATPRWESLGVPSIPSTLPDFDRHGGSSVHLLVRDGNLALYPKGVRDVVIAIGGSDGSDDAPCAGNIAAVMISDSVQSWDPLTQNWQARAPMLHQRVNHNAVILPTGAILVVGGTGLVANVGPGCAQVFEAEEYWPSEVFGGAPEGVWYPRAIMQRPRTYHSVAGLLPDGRVFCAGGDGKPGHPELAYHTVEIFRPSYFGRGDRPIITSWPAPVNDPIRYGPQDPNPVIDVTLTCADPTTIAKVVLIRSGAATHAFDMNQRYVELDFIPPEGAPSNASLAVIGPADGFVAPPGYYLLFVVDSNGVPSEGRWVRVGDV